MVFVAPKHNIPLPIARYKPHSAPVSAAKKASAPPLASEVKIVSRYEMPDIPRAIRSMILETRMVKNKTKPVFRPEPTNLSESTKETEEIKLGRGYDSTRIFLRENPKIADQILKEIRIKMTESNTKTDN